MKKIQARWQSRCHETGKTIRKGEPMYYDYGAKKCYSLASRIAKKMEMEAQEERSLKALIEASENAYFDNWYQRTYQRNY